MNNLTAYAHDIVSALTMRQVLTLYGVEVNAHGYALCPFHNEKTASLKVYEQKYYCFGCGAHGDVITFAMTFFDLPFKAALKKLNADFSLNLPIDERMTPRQARQYRRRCTEIEREKTARRQAEQLRRQEYYDLIGERARLDRAMRENAPKTPDEPLDAAFVEACQRLDYIDYLIENFDWSEANAAG